jgi:hypothetical protein
MNNVLAMLENIEDSEDFTEQEAEEAVLTTSSNDFVQKVVRYVRAGNVVRGYEVRRFVNHLYVRVSLTETKLVFRTDWIGS